MNRPDESSQQAARTSQSSKMKSGIVLSFKTENSRPAEAEIGKKYCYDHSHSENGIKVTTMIICQTSLNYILLPNSQVG